MEIEELNNENFEEKVLKSEEPFLVSFFNSNCPACHIFHLTLNEISKLEKTGLVNVYENPELSLKYKILAVPTVVIFKNGYPKERATGIRSKEVLLAKMNSLKNKN